MNVLLMFLTCSLTAGVRMKQIPPQPARGFRADFDENHCSFTFSPLMCQAQAGRGKFSAHAVVSTWQEDLHWLHYMHWEDNITVLVHNRRKQRSHGSTVSVADNLNRAESSEALLKSANSRRTNPIVFQDIPNTGDEAAAYLGWIIQKYNTLPDVVFFVQGHRCADHANFDMSIALPSIRQCFKPEQGYFDINTYRKGPETKCKSTKAILEKPVTGFKIEHFKDLWIDLFQEELGPMPPGICWDAYAQFAVTRERIKMHSVSFYKKLFKAVVQGRTTMEFFWRAIFVPEALKWKPIEKRAKEIDPDLLFTPEEIKNEREREVDESGQVDPRR
eukprot:CAMPEP_0171059038 /NCGR_PEP_ID=MMETSP0766_2-20121228/2930_1 /TAXON_ID=439317 /ORGANISM="Gambierdiscus australes, Strain CAWD 149" /LENGTH=331 /DNA_ID=CAMNT_0011514429 /DNA_START=55 /DNA_END=1050 /DNA_ORIENTATION=-